VTGSAARRVAILGAIVLAALSAVLMSSGGLGALGGGTVSAQTGTRVVNSNDYVASHGALAIQAAIDDVNGTGGGAVYVPGGTHLLDQKVRLYSNITLFGDGMDATILRFRDGAALDHMVSNDELSTRDKNIVIRDLTLSGRGATSGNYFGLRLVNVSDSTVINVASDGHGLDGFYLGYYNNLGVNNVRLSGCRARYNGRNGISLTHGSGNIIDGCQVENNNLVETVAGIDLEPDQGLNVSSNKVVSNVIRSQNVGIQLYSADRRTYVQGSNSICTNTARYNNSAGIWDYNGAKNIYVNNSAADNGGGSQVNIVVDGTAVFSSDAGTYCQLPALPSAPPKPATTTTPSPSPTGTPTNGSGVTLSASPTTILPGGTVTVSWAGITNPTTTDWIGLYWVGAVDTSTLDWKYVNCNQSPTTTRASGSCTFTMPTSAENFEFRLFANDGYTRLGKSNTVSVSSASSSTPTPTFTVTATPTPTFTVTATPTRTATPTSTTVAGINTPTRTPTSATSVPGTPAGLSAQARKGLIRLSWTASTTSGVTYIVYRGTVSGGAKFEIARVGAARFDDSAVAAGTTYYYQVTAVNAAGVESNRSNEASALAR
jgi:parallel beta-helix repeat protein